MSGPEQPLHRMLERQLRALDADAGRLPDVRTWRRLLRVVSQAYAEAESARYSIERALEVSSREMNELHAALERQARTDPLTGLANREGLRFALDRLIGPGRPGGVGLIYIDLDGFKAVNDTAGHEAGDAVLAEAAARLLGGVRGSDLVARLGGDEFVVVGPAVDRAHVAITAERLLAQLRGHYSFQHNTFRLGASIGVAFTAAGAATADDLLGRADRAMYAAKAAGKSRIVLEGEAGPVLGPEARSS